MRAMPPKKRPKVEKGQRFLTGFKGFEKDSAGNESASVGVSEDSDYSPMSHYFFEPGQNVPLLSQPQDILSYRVFNLHTSLAA